MLFSAKSEYACLAMLELAARYGDPRPVRLADIADKHGIPQRFLVQILLQLKGAGLVASTRGAAGGYQLARPPEEIALSDVLGVVDRADAPTNRGRGNGRRGDVTALAAALHGVWDRILTARQQILKQTTLAELVEAGQGLQYVI
ncbi:MAG TPA: Rrf2 family transcriptional regulator [Fimbriiglobus sp.]|jgi:Rrf2 family cysteine metabolism transcriptional repressor|nr:Rrf2 family transcriptional regulator [Fimbriiglobus sp.]